MRHRWPGLVVVSVFAVACSSIELPNGEDVRVVREMIPPEGKGVYVLIYRTELSPSDCPLIVKELDEVWSTVRARADQAQARLATIVAEAGNGASTVVTFNKSGVGWRQTQRPWGCEAKGAS